MRTNTNTYTITYIPTNRNRNIHTSLIIYINQYVLTDVNTYIHS